ncbi:TetR/AcrR family transcriptional regulator [Bacillus sp. 165]|uniref:TetR/AcrR family transcriptional regulator n=1 Tax=Bacillus sp. 165 TaxID=1529117 RepID=UPI001ADD220F|nr:TetR/AcrR family transcriptional regulator [Bacillus sp. 165]MBO9129886.1 TetR/AcrR family transcriptional regulator [Bacillus sp. 165]
MRNIIIDETWSLIVERGFQKFTMQDLAEKLHISKKTIYVLFKNKHQLISEAVSYIIENEMEMTLSCLNQKITYKEKLQAVIHYYYNYRFPKNVLEEMRAHFPHEWGKIERLNQFKITLFKDIYMTGVKEGVFRNDVNPVMIETIIDGTITKLLCTKLLTERDMKLNEALEDLHKILIRGIEKQ